MVSKPQFKVVQRNDWFTFRGRVYNGKMQKSERDERKKRRKKNAVWTWSWLSSQTWLLKEKKKNKQQKEG